MGVAMHQLELVNKQENTGDFLINGDFIAQILHFTPTSDMDGLADSHIDPVDVVNNM